MLLGLLIVGLGLGLWMVFVAPHLPRSAARNFTGDENRLVPAPAGMGPFYSHGELEGAEWLFLGDSRVHQGLVQRQLERALGARVAILWGPGAQIEDMLTLVADHPARWVVVSLSPLSIYAERNPEFDEILDQERPSLTADIDWKLGQAFEWIRTGLIPMVTTRYWPTSWVRPIDEDFSNVTYAARLRRATWKQRDAALERVERHLAQLLADGQRLACIRLPIATTLRMREAKAFAEGRFRELCQAVQVPFLDFYYQKYQTTDGSHLTAVEAQRFTEALASSLKDLERRHAKLGRK